MAKLELPKIVWLVEPKYDDDGVQCSAGLDQFGREHGDPIPTAPPIGFSAPGVDTLHEQIRTMVQAELFKTAIHNEGFETFDESEDFDVGDDNFPVDPHTPWEAVFDPPPASGPPGGGTAEARGTQPAASASPARATSSAGQTSDTDSGVRPSEVMLEQMPTRDAEPAGSGMVPRAPTVESSGRT